MTVLEIVTIPSEILRAPCADVTVFDAALHGFLDDMYESMVANNGIGLAAPQVAVSKRVAIVDISSDYIEQPAISSQASVPPQEHTHKQRLELINPRIISGTDKVPSDEGCLSIPDYRDSISRSYSVTVEALDRHGRPFSFEAEELLSFAVQHEIDHLNGILFTDHLSRLKKTLFKKWLIKNLGTDSV